MSDENNLINVIEKWNDEIYKFRVIAEVAEPDDQIEHYEIIEDIVAQKHELIEKLVSFDESGTVDRNHLTEEIESLQQNVEDAIEAARAKIN